MTFFKAQHELRGVGAVHDPVVACQVQDHLLLHANAACRVGRHHRLGRRPQLGSQPCLRMSTHHSEQLRLYYFKQCQSDIPSVPRAKASSCISHCNSGLKMPPSKAVRLLSPSQAEHSRLLTLASLLKGGVLRGVKSQNEVLLSPPGGRMASKLSAAEHAQVADGEVAAVVLVWAPAPCPAPVSPGRTAQQLGEVIQCCMGLLRGCCASSELFRPECS